MKKRSIAVFGLLAASAATMFAGGFNPLLSPAKLKAMQASTNTSQKTEAQLPPLNTLPSIPAVEKPDDMSNITVNGIIGDKIMLQVKTTVAAGASASSTNTTVRSGGVIPFNIIVNNGGVFVYSGKEYIAQRNGDVVQILFKTNGQVVATSQTGYTNNPQRGLEDSQIIKVDQSYVNSRYPNLSGNSGASANTNTQNSGLK